MYSDLRQKCKTHYVDHGDSGKRGVRFLSGELLFSEKCEKISRKETVFRESRPERLFPVNLPSYSREIIEYKRKDSIYKDSSIEINSIDKSSIVVTLPERGVFTLKPFEKAYKDVPMADILAELERFQKVTEGLRDGKYALVPIASIQGSILREPAIEKAIPKNEIFSRLKAETALWACNVVEMAPIAASILVANKILAPHNTFENLFCGLAGWFASTAYLSTVPLLNRASIAYSIRRHPLTFAAAVTTAISPVICAASGFGQAWMKFFAVIGSKI